jgi:hypothetical protein
MSTSRFALSFAVVFLLAGCGDGQPDPDAVAAAKCHLPLVQELKPTSEQRVEESNVEVRDLGKGRREVTGSVSVTPGGNSSSFLCVVTPDATDKLRGLRVQRLDVQ